MRYKIGEPTSETNTAAAQESDDIVRSRVRARATYEKWAKRHDFSMKHPKTKKEIGVWDDYYSGANL